MTTADAAAAHHEPVMLERVLELLTPALSRPGSVCVDATLGLGGHSEAVLRAVPGARLVGIDRDPAALRRARDRLAPFGDRFTAVHAVYDDLPTVLADLGLPTVDAALFDLGVSSMQLDDLDRGFAYAHDAPLDMRMDQSTGPSAADVVNGYEAKDLERVLRDYGEERFARRIAGAIVRRRVVTPFTRSADLVELLREVVPAASQRTGGHPAKRTFQALRIEINAELRVWERALPRAVEALCVGGRIVVLSYHSLEDRITKRVLRDGATGSTPRGLPVELPGHGPYLKLLTRGAEVPSARELADNPRSASARLRAAEKISGTVGVAA